MPLDNPYHSDTIVAIATPPGRGGVGIVRISGPSSINIGTKLVRRKMLSARQALFGNFYDESGQILDEGLILFFPNPHSFTGEDVVECQIHGSPIILDVLVKNICHYGARIARPGEFSERAFLNDKMDLAQAEAIADLIAASSERAARMAVNSLQGIFSDKVRHLTEELIHCRLYVESAIDFPDEEIDFLSDGHVLQLVDNLLENLQSITDSACQGALMQEGISVVIAGRPNAGKSTLINALSGQDIAIVTDIAGTTRDVMRQHVLLDDIPLHLVDTAGLRNSNDPVEKEGIRRAWQEVSRADCVLLVVDVTDDKEIALDSEVRAVLPDSVPIITVHNKIDKQQSASKIDEHHVFMSAKTADGLNLLKALIKKAVGYQPAEGHFIARRRHLDALSQAKSSIEKGRVQLTQAKAGELLAEELRQAQRALDEITGEFTSDDLLGKIFSSFCIGK